jgi:hypothetical protein
MIDSWPVAASAASNRFRDLRAIGYASDRPSPFTQIPAPEKGSQMSLHGPVARNRQYHNLATSDKLNGRKSASGTKGRSKH